MTADAEPDSMRAEAEACLRVLAGADARLRDDQWTAIRALVADRVRALVVQRTGWGKSAVYFVATALLRARGAGPTVIVSPLLALMRNQVEAAGRAGIRAATIQSAKPGDRGGQRGGGGRAGRFPARPPHTRPPRARGGPSPRGSPRAGWTCCW